MGIITKEVEVKPRGKMIQYYKDKGYDAKYNVPLIVKIEDLPKSSNLLINVLCDYCRKESYPRYNDYNNSIEKFGAYACYCCRHEQNKQNNLVKYGVEYYVQSEQFQEQVKNTCRLKYNVENVASIPEVKEKRAKTNIERYGYKSPSSNNDIKEKIRKTSINKFGVSSASKSPIVKEKIRLTNLSRYGVEWTQQSPEIRAKANETLCNNGAQKISKQQLYLHSLFGGELNYPIKYYAVDICFLDEKIYLEYSGGGHNLRVTLGRLTQEEFDQKELVRNNILRREGYKKIEIISSKDKLPSDIILLEMLSYARNYFSEFPNHSWIEFDIDSSTVRNAENKEGVFFNYGELRKIKDIDLNKSEEEVNTSKNSNFWNIKNTDLQEIKTA